MNEIDFFLSNGGFFNNNDGSGPYNVERFRPGTLDSKQLPAEFIQPAGVRREKPTLLLNGAPLTSILGPVVSDCKGFPGLLHRLRHRRNLLPKLVPDLFEYLLF